LECLKSFNLGGMLIPKPIQRRERERGTGRLKTVVVLAFLAALIYVAVKLVPPFVENYQLEDAMKQEARFAGVNRKDPDAIRNDVYKKIQELEIPARREDIRVESIAPFSVRISLDYSVPVDLRIYQFRLQFHPTGDSSSL
jgi:hypothetical protein